MRLTDRQAARAIDLTVERAERLLDLSSLKVIEYTDRHGGKVYDLIAVWQGLKFVVTLEVFDEEGTAFLPEKAINGFAVCGGNLAESPDEVDDLISLLKRARDLLRILQTAMTDATR